jgi:inorganic pyrophosphatase/K(+)-stimulated pyrophosphate-energized sodium pump
MGADLFESYMGSILAASVLGVAAALQLGDDIEGVFARLAAPMLLAALGIGLSILGTYLVRTREGASMKQLMHALDRGIWAAAGLTIVAAGVLFWLLDLGWGPWGAVVTGLAVGLLIGRATEYYTSGDFGPTQKISASAEAGTGPLIISGLAWGMLSTWAPIVLVAVGTLVAFAINDGFGTGGHATGLYGVALAAVGMLSTLGITLATDAYGPIADNAGGNAEMSGLEPQVRERTDALDSLGNTTAAIGKGFAIGSAALTALALLAAYVEEVRVNIHREVADAQVEQVEGAAFAILDAGHGKYGMFLPPAGEDPDEVDRRDFTISLIASNTEDAFELPGWSEEGEPPHVIINRIGSGLTADRDDDAQGGLIAAPAAAATGRAGMNDYMAFYDVTLMNPKVLCGLLMGVMLVFVFSALTMQAVGRAAMAMVNEVRRQFAEKPGIMKGDDTPDYARCVLISTRGAQREMVVPSLLAISVPIAVGLVLDVAGVIGLLLGGLCAGYAMAVFMANAGGAWDNAKKLIETGEHGGKNSDAHRAAVVGDTVGDPFKDTAGPSLNILIKLMSMVSIVFAGLIVRFGPVISDWLGLS